ncbi:MAG: kelch repeat-containing protein [Gammaproteobacteria bacterium]|nr:kelch repeat-containing protein [Gammaproteobacteria bacterium]
MNISGKQNPSKSLISLLLLAFLVAACGGGGGSDDDDDVPFDPGSPPAPPSNNGIDLEISLAAGDYWEFYWFNETSTFAQGSGTSSSADFGIFRVTLGSSVNAGGEVAFPLTVTGDPGSYAPRWTHVAINADGSLLGSTDGAQFALIFDATDDSWNGGGFFHDFASNEVSIGTRTLQGEYNSVSATRLGYSDSDGGCDTILGITLCADSSTTFSFYEFYKQGVGPVGFRQDTTYSSSGGGFFTSTTIRKTVELIETSETANDGSTFNRPDWQEMAPLATARDNHAAVVLNGKIYVIGGLDSNSNELLSMEIYDPVADSWSIGAPLPAAGAFGEAHVIGGKIYIKSDNASDVHVYDPATGWSTVTTIGGGQSFGASDTYNDTIFGNIIVGVLGASVFDSLETVGYQPSGNQWLVGTNLSIRELLRPSVTVVGDTMYVIGGFGGRFSCSFSSCDRGALDWVLKYDLTNDTWDEFSADEMNVERDNLETVNLNGKILAIGGNPVGCSFSGSCSIGNPLRSAEIYDPVANSWTEISSMLNPRKDFAAVVLNGDVYVIGGYDGNDETTSVERYRP